MIRSKKQLDEPPVYDKLLNNNGEHSLEWSRWFNRLHQYVKEFSFLSNDYLTINPDFHWSRTKGNTATTADGEFVEEWFVKADSVPFTITPTFYTSTTFSSDTGSQRYVNISIPTPDPAKQFDIYQQYPNYLSKFQNKDIAVSALIKNNNSNRNTVRFYLGIDTDNSGTDDFIAQSKSMIIDSDTTQLSSIFKSPVIDADNQSNTVTIK